MKKLFLILALSLVFAVPVIAKSDKVTICHAAGREGTTHYVTLTISENAVYGRKGNAGHFEENGTPRAGHEQDYFGPCKTDNSSSPTPTESAKPTPSPSLTPSPSERPKPTETPEVPDTAMH